MTIKVSTRKVLFLFIISARNNPGLSLKRGVGHTRLTCDRLIFVHWNTQFSHGSGSLLLTVRVMSIRSRSACKRRALPDSDLDAIQSMVLTPNAINKSSTSVIGGGEEDAEQ